MNRRHPDARKGMAVEPAAASWRACPRYDRYGEVEAPATVVSTTCAGESGRDPSGPRESGS